MSLEVFRPHVAAYLRKKQNIGKIESLLSLPLQDEIYINVPRIMRYIHEVFKIKLNVKGFVARDLEEKIEEDVIEHHNKFKKERKVLYNFGKDSENYIAETLPKLEKETVYQVDFKGNKIECHLDSKHDTEKYCTVEKDQLDTDYYFDAVLKKVNAKKYYYGQDTFYVLQLIKDHVKNLFIIWTRWGETGTEGQYQRTPFQSLELARLEFHRIFKQKTGWKWTEVNNYAKLPKKFDIKRIGGKNIAKTKHKLKFADKKYAYEELVTPIDEIGSKVKRK